MKISRATGPNGPVFLFACFFCYSHCIVLKILYFTPIFRAFTTGNPPAPRYHHSAVVHEGSMFVFGKNPPTQQGVWVPFWTPKPLKRTPQDTQNILCGISKNLNLKLIIEYFHLLIIPMTFFNDIMPYFDEFIHVYGWNMSILWSPLKSWTPKKFTTANFRHPVSKSWLRHRPHHHLPHVWGFYILLCQRLG